MINQKVQTETQKKLKKVRSIRLARLSSMKSSTRGQKPQHDNLSILSSVESENLEQQNPIEVVDASPNYMKGTSSSHAKDNFQITEKPVTRKILTRVSTLKLKRSMTRKNRKNDNDDDGNKSKRVISRRLTLKPVRILNRIPTFKSMKKGSKISQIQDSRLHKSTCSSTLKGSQEGSSSQGESSKKVCPYSYCSLHGHRHENSPPLKRFVSMRRRQLKSQNGRSKQFGNARKVTEKNKSVYSEDGNSGLQNRSNFEVTDEIEWNDKNMKNDESASVESTSTDEVVKFSVSEGKNMKAESKVLQKRDRKYVKMWHLMYKNAVMNNTGKCETDQDMDDEKKNVIELVQKAFDEILLPEAEDVSSLVPSLSETSEGNREERNVNASTFTESPEEVQKMETKSEQRAPKSWSHLKKVILLKRFVKALEKVRNVNFRRPRELPLDADFEAEKVLLKQQTAEERKKAEKWMLDYALQNVISKLAPAQRQRVTLLIEAFETILPTQDAENGSPRTDPIQSHGVSSDHRKEETDKGSDYVYSAKTFLGKASNSHNSTKEFADNASDNQMPELHNPIVELKETWLDNLEIEKNQNKPASTGVIEEDLDGKQRLASSNNNGKKISIDNDNIYHVEEARTEEIVNETNDEEARTDQIVSEVQEDLISNLSAALDSTSTDFVNLSVSEGKNMEPDCKVLQKSFVQEQPSTTDEANGMQKRDQKYIKMWQLIYKNAVLSNTGKSVNMPHFDEGREKDALTFNGGNYCETDQDMEDAKKNVIELVQKAFDEILLPEAEGLSSLVPEKSEGTREERNANGSAFTESPEEAKKMETKPEQRGPKSWSHLKKVILLKRFVKALEKVRNINLRRPRQLPSDADFEVENVFLQQQTAEERKKAEEWMLDYALQNGISKLQPAQRQRVTLLIEAFETILPTQDAENVSPQTNLIQSHGASSDHSKKEKDKGRDYVYSAKTFLEKTSYSHNSTIETADNVSDNQMPELQNPIERKERCLDNLETEKIQNNPASCGAIEEDLDEKQSLASSYNNGEKISIDNDNIYHVEEARTEEIVNEANVEEARTEEIVNEANDEEARTEVIVSETNDEEARTDQIVNEVLEDLISSLNTENVNIKPKSPVRYSETKNVINGKKEQFSVSKSLLLNGLVRSLRSNLVGSEAPSNVLDEETIDRKEKTEKAELETETLEEKQGNKGLWYMVYKHMVSDATENNSLSLTDGADEKESRNEGNRTREASVSNESTPVNVINQEMHLKDNVVGDSDVELRQLEAIKMVEEAIDTILPDVQDNSSIQVDRTERMESGNGTAQEQKEEETVTKEGSEPKKPMSRSWSNLKKVILLRRFIKALEKVRKFNPRGPRFLPVENDPEGEKVELRHQDMAERKGTEEWMLDYALRQVVSKLTPARKRKVELLVEAFETVVPTIKN